MSGGLSLVSQNDWGRWPAEQVQPPILKSKKRPKPTVSELRKMVRDKNKAAWIGLVLTILIQAVTFSFWIGTLSMQVASSAKKLEEMNTEQRQQGQLVYSMPYIKQSVEEIKGDLKDLKTLIIENHINPHKRS